MKLCTHLIGSTLCGEPCDNGRCDDHQPKQPSKLSREARGYNDAWRKLSRRARDLQPWCSNCGTTEDLTCDHLEWPATTLKQVDVLCRTCNARKGKPTTNNDPRGKTLTAPPPHPGRRANVLTQFDNDSHLGGVRG